MANDSKKAVAKAKTTPTHPPTSSMVNSAIESLKERGGSSLPAIKKYLTANYQVDVEKLSPYIKTYLRSAVANGQLVQTKGKGASGSFKLPISVNKKSKQPSPKAAKKQPAEAKMKAAKKPGRTVKNKASKNIKPKTVWHWGLEPPAGAKKAPATKKPSKKAKVKTITYWAKEPPTTAEIAKMFARDKAQKEKAPKKTTAQKAVPKKTAAQKAAPKKTAPKTVPKKAAVKKK